MRARVRGFWCGLWVVEAGGWAAHRVCGQVDLRLERHADEREDLAGAVLEGRHPPHHLAVHLEGDAATQRLG